MTEINRVPLHAIIGARTRWSEELWAKVVEYFDGKVAPEIVEAIYAYLYGSPSLTYTTSELLSEFRFYPPTVILGFYDLVRWRNAVDRRLNALTAELRR